MIDQKVSTLIKQLDLQPHPEGGFFKETYRSEGSISNQNLSVYSGGRNHSTCIYYMLVSGSFSAFHRIHQDEIWHFYDGSPVELHTISPEGVHEHYLIGRDISGGEIPQLVVPGNHWFASKVAEPDSYSLVGCTVAPGFDFDDFELADKNELLEKYPEHKTLIMEFTRDQQ